MGAFTFASVIGWASQRRREREAYYRYEFRKKLVDDDKFDAVQLQALTLFELKADLWRQRHKRMARGLALTGLGVGSLLGLRFIDHQSVWMLGYIPLFLGVAMLAYAWLLAPREARRFPSDFQDPDATR